MNLTEYIKSKEQVLALYFTAGYPALDDTTSILKALDLTDVDLIEIGIPYSDSLVDGPVIQESNSTALKNGINLDKIFEQIGTVKDEIETPYVLMGSFNPVLQYGIEKFVETASAAGVSALIIPDMPAEEYEAKYQSLFQEYNLGCSFLVAPNTEVSRIKYLDSLTNGFIYAVSSRSITGNRFELDDDRRKYLTNLKELDLKNPFLVGFGIHDSKSFQAACELSHGAIIGTEFIRALGGMKDFATEISQFVNRIKSID